MPGSPPSSQQRSPGLRGPGWTTGTPSGCPLQQRGGTQEPPPQRSGGRWAVPGFCPGSAPACPARGPREGAGHRGSVPCWKHSPYRLSPALFWVPSPLWVQGGCSVRARGRINSAGWPRWATFSDPPKHCEQDPNHPNTGRKTRRLQRETQCASESSSLTPLGPGRLTAHADLKLAQPWPAGSAVWSTVLCTKRLQVRFP